MTIKEWQEKVDDWISTYGVRYFDVKTNTLLLGEEYGEFARLIARKYGEQSFKDQKEEECASDFLKEELADIIFVITCIANQLDIDIESELEKNISKKSSRDHSRHKQNKKL